MNKLTVLIIIPNYNQGIKNYNAFFPIGIPYVVSIIEKCGYEVDVLNLNFVNGTGKIEIIKELERKRYDIVGTGGTVFDFCAIESIFSTVKQYNPQTIRLLGGRILLYDSELIFSKLDADYGVIGDADETLPALLNKIAYKTEEVIYNTIFKENGNTIKTPFVANRNLIDSLPYPNIIKCGYEEICRNQSNDSLQYSYHTERKWKVYSVAPTFNCTHNCTFCANGKQYYRARTGKSLSQELDYALMYYGIDVFDFTADVFSVNWKEVENLCSDINLLKTKYQKEIHFVISMRIKGFTSDKAELLKSSGCIGVFFGFDSYDDNVLKSMKKGITSEDIRSAIQICKSINLVYSGCFIFGDIAETKESYLRTLDFWRENCKGFVAITPIVILPGAELMNYSVEKGVITDKSTYYRELSLKRDYFLLSKRLSPYMTDHEHNKMLNVILSYSLKYQFYTECKTIRSKSNKTYTVMYNCGNCSNPNKREEVSLQYKLFAWTVCPHCGSTNLIHRLPPFIVNIGTGIAAFLIQYFGVQLIKIRHALKRK